MVAISAVCAQLWRGLRRKPTACPTKAVDGVLKLLGSEAKAKLYRDRRCSDEKGLSSSASA
ncbi:hypothetical protein [uncultured Porphyromonas sp.]|uniref:hypothetical protein n=1 Tax=uncultured Porphyromonas sp. TaxID=159274 RepID=UPI00260FD312|nr:hypothetical protein [uncultured Porphyromonas sp.]